MKAINYEMTERPGIVLLNEKNNSEITEVAGGFGDGVLGLVAETLVVTATGAFVAFVWSSPAQKQAAYNRLKTGCISLAGVLRRGEVANIFYSTADADAENAALVAAANGVANQISALPTTATATQISAACTAPGTP